MKQFFLSVAIAAAALSGCIKNDPVIYAANLAELDATTVNANAAGFTYPIIGRRPAYTRAVGVTDSTIRRYTQTIQIRVNMTGAQSAKDETVGYEIFSVPSTITAFSFPATVNNQTPTTLNQTPASPAASLPLSDAVTGTDYTIGNVVGTVTIPAKSSFGYIPLTIVGSSASAVQGKFIGIRLNDKGSIKPSVNYSQLGLVIDKR